MFPLYCILDTARCAARGLDPLATADGFLRGGARLLQLRDKQPSSAARLALAEALVTRVHAAGARLIVNDYADIAVMSGADGVHVGQDDLEVEDARRVVGPSRLVGVSTHDERQFAAAERSTADYLAVGPIYETATKATGYTARGLDLLRTLAAASAKPVVAIGGITLERAGATMAAGAASVAVISDLLGGGDVEARTAAFLERLRSGR